MSTLYETDFYAWTEQQAGLLNLRNTSMLDYNNLIEEIDALGRSEKRTLTSFLRNALLHMLKIRYQPSWHTKSWDNSIAFSINDAKEVLKDSPSLRFKLPEIYVRAYELARRAASKETGLDYEMFPQECPWTIEQVLGE